jgi:esterase/lipase superfamily enzyme
MLIITNRKPNLSPTSQDSGRAFSSKFAAGQPTLSIVNAFNSSVDTENPQWTTENTIIDAADAQIKKRISEFGRAAAAQGRSVLVYIHGNNNDFAKMLQRCHFLSQTYEHIEVIGFSWPSEGFPPGIDSRLSAHEVDMGDDDGVANEKMYKNWFAEKRDRYLQATRNAHASAAALGRCLALFGALKSSDTNTVLSIAAHSLGNELLRKTTARRGINSDLSSFCNVVLAAPAVDATLQASFLNPLSPQKRVFVTFNKNDWVLAGASVVDGDTKLGTNPTSTPNLSSNEKVRYVDFEGAASGAGHRYFLEGSRLDMKRKERFKVAKRFFDRTLSRFDDILIGESEGKIYPLRCSSNGKFCYMGPETARGPNDSPGG